MTVTCNPDPGDTTLEIAERQLVMLGELAQMAMAAARAFTASAIASAKAAEAILDDEYFMPEVGRARACGAKDAAESLQKVTRAVRLTLMLEMKVSEIARDIRAGVVTYIEGAPVRKDTCAPAEGPRSFNRSAGVLADCCSDARKSDVTRSDKYTERLIDIERPDILPRAPFRETVDLISADLGATVDWATWQIEPSDRSEDRTPERSRIAGVSPASFDRRDAGGTPALQKRGELTPVDDPPAPAGLEANYRSSRTATTRC